MQRFTLVVVYLTSLHADDSLTRLMTPVLAVTFHDGRLTRRRRSVGRVMIPD